MSQKNLRCLLWCTVSVAFSFLMVSAALGGISSVSNYTKLYCADVNNDGFPDILVANYTSAGSSVSLYLNPGNDLNFLQNNNPSYTFSNIPTTDLYNTAAFADLRCAGVFDFFYFTNSGLKWRQNTGDSVNFAWSTSGTSISGISTIASVFTMGFADIDGDGDLDFVVADVQGNIYFFLNKDYESDGWVDGKCNGGNVTFSQMASPPLRVLHSPGSKIFLTDFDGDGRIDLLDSGDAPFLLYRNNGSPSNFSLNAYPESVLQGLYQGIHQSPVMECFNSDQFMDVIYTNSAGYIGSIDHATRASDGAIDGNPPVVASPGLQLDHMQSNAGILKWPRAFDNQSSTYVSGIKYYALYRTIQSQDPNCTPSDGNLIWKHYQQSHYPDYVPGFASGDKFKIQDNSFYYFNANLQGGSTYLYRLKVVDYAGNAYLSDTPVAVPLLPSQMTTLHVQLTPATSQKAFTLSVSILDQYENPFPIQKNPSGGNNVVFQVYIGNPPVNSGLTLNKINPAPPDDPLPDDLFDNIASRSYSVTVPSQDCLNFLVHVVATDYLNPGSPVMLTGDSAMVLLEQTVPALPDNLSANPLELTATTATLRWNAVTDTCSSITGYKVYYCQSCQSPFTSNQFSLVATVTGTSYTHSNLTPGATYHYYVTAVDSIGNESVMDPLKVISVTLPLDITPPTIPQALSGRYNTSLIYVTLTWTPSSDIGGTGVDKYEIQRKDTESGSYYTIVFVTHPTATYRDNFSYPGHSVYYRVRAYDKASPVNVSGFSNEAEVTVQVADTTPPSVPTNLSGNANGPYSIYLSWGASTDNTGGSGVRSYQVFRNNSSLPVGEVFTTNFLDTNLTPETSYTYQVRATDVAGNYSDRSSAISVRSGSLAPTKPNPPKNLSSTKATQTTIDLAWDAPDDNGIPVSYYRVYFQGHESPLKNHLSTTSTQITGLVAGNTYAFVATAVSDTGGESNPSNILMVATTSPAPTQPTNLQATPHATTVDLTWTASIGIAGATIDHYDIKKMIATPFGPSPTMVGSSPTNAYTVTGLEPSTNYTFLVQAIDNRNQMSLASDPVSVTTTVDDHIPPPIPTGLTATAQDMTRIKLVWIAVQDEQGGSGLAGYRVYRGGQLLATVTTAEYMDTGLSQSTGYSYQVSAVDRAGNPSDKCPAVTASTLGPEKSLYCAHVASGTDWFTYLTLVNIGTTDRPIDLTAIKADGTMVEKITINSLPPNVRFEKELAEIFGTGTLANDLWVKITSEAKLKGMVSFGTKDNQSLTGIPMFTLGATDLIFPYVYMSDTCFTGLTLVNISPDTATAYLDAYTESGSFLGRSQIEIPAGGKYANLVDGIFRSKVSDPTRIRFVQLMSTQSLVGFELFGSLVDKGLAGLPAFSLTVELFKDSAKRDEDGSGNQGTNGETLMTAGSPSTPTGFQGVAVSSNQINLSWNANPESEVEYTVYYWPPSSFWKLTVGTTSQTNFSVTETSSGHPLLPETTYELSLTAKYKSGGPESEETSHIKVTTLAQGEHDYNYRVYYNEIPDPTKYFTGLTFSNMDVMPTTVHMELYDQTGQKIGEHVEQDIAPKAQVTRSLESFFGSPLPSGAAYIKIGAMEKLLGFELYLTRKEVVPQYQFDGIIGLTGGSTLLDFPLVKTGTDWTSYLRLTNVTTAVCSLTVRAWAADGTAKGTYTASLASGAKTDKSLTEMFPDTAKDIAWLSVEGSVQLMGDLFCVSTDLTRMVSYVGLKAEKN